VQGLSNERNDFSSGKIKNESTYIKSFNNSMNESLNNSKGELRRYF